MVTVHGDAGAAQLPHPLLWALPSAPTQTHGRRISSALVLGVPGGMIQTSQRQVVLVWSQVVFGKCLKYKMSASDLRKGENGYRFSLRRECLLADHLVHQ